MKALVADDSTVGRRILFGILQHDCEIEDVMQVSDGEEAIKAIKDNDFGLVLLDWNMPKVDGIDVLREIRKMGLKTPVIMVTGESDKAHVVEAYESGTSDYIVKPFSPRVVAQKVERILDKARALPKDRGAETALVVDDSDVIRRMLASILQERCGFEEITQAGDGAEAVDAVKGQDFDLILLDWNMPNMLGIDALKAIRGMGNKTPIIMVTSEKEGTRVVEAFDAGANNYIIKPFEPSSLADKVKQVLHVHA